MLILLQLSGNTSRSVARGKTVQTLIKAGFSQDEINDLIE